MVKILQLILTISIFVNITAQENSTVLGDTGTASEEAVSAITAENKDAAAEDLLDSIYNSEEEDTSSIEVFEEVEKLEKSNVSIENKVLSVRKEIKVEKLKKSSVVKNKKNSDKSFDLKKILRLAKKYILKIVILIVSLLSIILVIVFLRKKVDSTKFLTSTRLSLMDKEVQIACKYMESNFSDPNLTVETLCAELVTGAAFLEALFVKELGMGIMDFLRQVRINRARIALHKEPQMPVYELAEKCGYSNSELFENDFVNTTGLSIDDFIATIQQ